MMYSLTHGYASVMDPDRMFSTREAVKAYDKMAARCALGFEPGNLPFSDDERKAIKLLAELIKEEETDAFLAEYNAEQGAA